MYVPLSSAQCPPTMKTWCCQLQIISNALLLTRGLHGPRCLLLLRCPQNMACHRGVQDGTSQAMLLTSQLHLKSSPRAAKHRYVSRQPLWWLLSFWIVHQGGATICTER